MIFYDKRDITITMSIKKKGGRLMLSRELMSLHCSAQRCYTHRYVYVCAYIGHVLPWVLNNFTLEVWSFFFSFVEYSEPANSPRIDILERSPTSVLDISCVKSNYLHQLVSEGNLSGVRWVHFNTHSLTAVFFYVFQNHWHFFKPVISSSLDM